MYVRLAFAVAANLDPEILMVDEVLAVGDVAFQKKCLGKMGDVARTGRTVLFVSHNMAVIQALCERGICIRCGKIISDGPISDVVDVYLSSFEKVKNIDVASRTDRRGRGQVKLNGVEITNGGDSGESILKAGGPARFTFHLDAMIANLSCGFVIVDDLGQSLVVFKSDLPSPEDTIEPRSHVSYTCKFDELLLMPGRYRVDVFIRGGGEGQDFIEAAAFFDVEVGQLRGRPIVGPTKSRTHFVMPHSWILPS
jgi:lipopolysaccharide transport system ATP-binding protein